MRTYRRKPQWEVVIKRPNYSSSTLSFVSPSSWTAKGKSTNLIRFVDSATKENGTDSFTDLIAYDYSESISNPATEFSLTLVPRMDSKNRTWKEKIQPWDIVYIYEFGKLRYIGIVRKTGYSMSLNGGKPQRSITIGGTSIGGVLQKFMIPMNIYLWYNKGQDPTAQNKALQDAINGLADKDQTIANMLQALVNGFLGVAFGSSSVGFTSIVNQYINFAPESTLKAYYPLNLRPYQVGENNLWQMMQGILPPPVYEIFGRYKDEQYEIICRECPFDQDTWDALNITKIDPLYLIDQNLNDSDDEVFTHYYSIMPQSLFSENENYAVTGDIQNVSVFDEDKLPIYGYRKLEATFPYFDLDKGKDEDYQATLKNNSLRLYAWFHNNLEFQSGTITLMTVPDKNNNYPQIGERLQYLVGSNYTSEFYIEGVKRTMNYSTGIMTSAYSVTRGYGYGSNSITIAGSVIQTPQVCNIENLGQKLLQAERDALTINE